MRQSYVLKMQHRNLNLNAGDKGELFLISLQAFKATLHYLGSKQQYGPI